MASHALSLATAQEIERYLFDQLAAAPVPKAER
jgi:hypothetical protein